MHMIHIAVCIRNMDNQHKLWEQSKVISDFVVLQYCKNKLGKESMIISWKKLMNIKSFLGIIKNRRWLWLDHNMWNESL